MNFSRYGTVMFTVWYLLGVVAQGNDTENTAVTDDEAFETPAEIKEALDRLQMEFKDTSEKYSALTTDIEGLQTMLQGIRESSIQQSLDKHSAQLANVSLAIQEDQLPSPRMSVFLSINNSLTAAQVELESENTRMALMQRGRMYHATGYVFRFYTGFLSSTSLVLPNQANGPACLETCVLEHREACHMVGYDNVTQACTGYAQDVEGMMVPSATSSLLAYSRKRFTVLVGESMGGSRHKLLVAPGPADSAGSNKVEVLDRAMCLVLCHVHPQCGAFMEDVNPEAGDAQTNPVFCFLAAYLPDRSAINAHYTTYLTL